MEHFAILKSLVRVAMAHDTPPLRHQIERLAEAMSAAGETKEAAALRRTLSTSAREHGLTPSRIAKSNTTLEAGERLTSSVPVPVDKESSANLATVTMPEDIHVSLPLFPNSVQENIEALIQEWANATLLGEAGMRATQSVLVYGAPGTGKTTLALWLAKSLGMPVVLARLDGLISSYLGTTARNLGALFAFANRYECVLVLDEFDAIAKVRDDPNEVGEIKRVVNALLQNMDSRDGHGITIGLTNHEALLDPAIWRRFEVQLSVPLPEFEQRIEIARRFLDDHQERTLPEAKLLSWVCDGVSGAELQTMATKYRKRRLLQASSGYTAIQTVTQLARSTSVHISAEKRTEIESDEATLTRQLASAEQKFSKVELAMLFECSTKTIARRLDLASEDGGANAE
ncbi:ATP-binding protein [uncultured Salinibacterium sp.]|uniref:ATP-binding protein n=1 Tax=uncultured Salinibacterium sp. TaxID=459274 RepID=UPI0030DB9526